MSITNCHVSINREHVTSRKAGIAVSFIRPYTIPQQTLYEHSRPLLTANPAPSDANQGHVTRSDIITHDGGGHESQRSIFRFVLK